MLRELYTDFDWWLPDKKAQFRRFRHISKTTYYEVIFKPLIKVTLLWQLFNSNLISNYMGWQQNQTQNCVATNKHNHLLFKTKKDNFNACHRRQKKMGKLCRQDTFWWTRICVCFVPRVVLELWELRPGNITWLFYCKNDLDIFTVCFIKQPHTEQLYRNCITFCRIFFAIQNCVLCGWHRNGLS